MIPYNPSSFNSNKTILEQILELKKWLKEHPSYAVYTTYIHYKPAENVDYFFTEINGDPDFVDNIAVGDLLWFGDGYISPIASITIDPNDRENSYVTISQPVTSLIGPTGPQGPRGYDGVSVTNASVNASGYLIITLSNGLTVNTGYVVGPQGPQGPTGATGPQGPTGPTGADGNDGVSITNVAIDGNQHLIVTLSDGSTIDAGSVSSGGMEVVTITSTSGTLSVDDFNKLDGDNCILIEHTGSNYNYFTKAKEDAGTIYYKRDIADNGSTYQYEIIRATRAYTRYFYQISGSAIKSTGATSGQVLTADGNGNSSWQTPSGSGIEVVTITSTSGTISADDLVKLDNNAILIHQPNLSTKIYYMKRNDDGMYYRYMGVYSSNNTIIDLYEFAIRKTTGVYSRSSLQLTSNDINSESATSGQVLTSNGNGTASWQNASGGAQIFRYNASTIDFTRLINIVKNGHIVSGTYEMIVGGVNRIINANTIFNRTDNANRIYIDGEVGGYGSNQVNIWIFSGQIDSTGILSTYSQAILLSNDGQSVSYRVSISDMKNIDIYYIASSEITQ